MISRRPDRSPGEAGYDSEYVTFMLVTFVIGALFAWAAYRVRPQRESATALGERGGQVRYDPRYSRNQEPKWKNWVVDRVGIDYFHNVSKY